MKNNIKKIMSLLFAGILVSCAKDEIEVVKNIDTTWSVDESITNSDIRTKLGYDPRYDYVFAPVNEVEFPMLSLGNFSLSGQNKAEIEVQLLKPLNKDLNVSLVYDATLYDKVKEKYSGYSLGEEKLVQIAQKQQTITAGQTSVSFELVMNNNSSFKESVIIPFSVVSADASVRLLNTKEQVIVKVFNKEVTYTYPTEINKTIRTNATSSIYDVTTISFDVKASSILSDAISLSVQRASGTSISNLAPEGVEGVLPAAVDFKDSETGRFSLKLDKTKLEAGKTYLLPLQIVAKIGSQTYTLPNSIAVIIKTVGGTSSNAKLATSISGNRMSFRDIRVAYTASGTYSGNTAIDGISTGGAWLENVREIKLSFTETKILSSFRILYSYGTNRFSKFDVYAVDVNGNEVAQGTITVSDTSNPIVKFEAPIQVAGLKIKNIQIKADDWIRIGELEFYEE